MKHLSHILTALVLLLSPGLWAQAPQQVSYQAGNENFTSFSGYKVY
ncbi:MAG: hypothetical protein JWO03_2951 [Bacteroidetes bacterium]|nr:hypothetical protein [Bacteroidota bacterium]